MSYQHKTDDIMPLRVTDRKLRAEFIVATIAMNGRLNRREIMEAFSCSSVTASSIMTRFLREFPGAVDYDRNIKAHLPGPRFQEHWNTIRARNA